MRIGNYVAKVLLAATTMSGCAFAAPAAVTPDNSSALDTVFFWQDEALALIKKYQLNPVRAGRVLAYLHQLTDRIAGESASAKIAVDCTNSAVDVAASRMVEYFFPYETAGRIRALAQLRSGNSQQCAAARGIAADLAEQSISTAMKDGVHPPRRIRAVPDASPGTWAPTAPTFSQNPTEPFAENWKPFLIESTSKIRIPPPPSPSSLEYRRAMDELVSIRESLSPSQIALADAWHLDAGTVTPPGVWNTRIRELIGSSKLPARKVIRLLAVSNMAMHDAFIACWQLRYTYWVERPITAAGRLGHTKFVPWLVTPSFPGYPSGLACVSGAVSAVAAAYMPEHERALTSLAEDAAVSRIYGGIHFRFDVEAGLDAGRQVGAIAIKQLPPG